MQLAYTDAGRKDCGYAGESQDCVVRAFAIAGNTTYDVAHLFCKEVLQRKAQDGVYTRLSRAVREFYGHPVRYEECPHKSVGGYIDSHPSGRYIVYIRGHAFGVVDGVAHDMNSRTYLQRKHVAFVLHF